MRSRPLALLVVLGLAACADNVLEPRRMDGEFSAALIYGYVTTGDGTPIADASVRLESHVLLGCSGLRERTTVRTDASGRYARVLGNWGRPFDACVRVWAEPGPDAAGIAPDSTSRASVHFGSVLADSVRMDLVLSLAP